RPGPVCTCSCRAAPRCGSTGSAPDTTTSRHVTSIPSWPGWRRAATSATGSWPAPPNGSAGPRTTPGASAWKSRHRNRRSTPGRFAERTPTSGGTPGPPPTAWTCAAPTRRRSTTPATPAPPTAAARSGTRPCASRAAPSSPTPTRCAPPCSTASGAASPTAAASSASPWSRSEMSTDNARKALARSTLAMLPRVSDGLSFLFVDICRVVQTDTGVCAEVETDAGAVHRVPIPTASLACVLLGPGTSITSPAMATFMRHNTTVVNCGAGGILNYGSFPAPNRTTKWSDRQARAYSDDQRRLEIATRMYQMRFGAEPPPGTSVERLRQLEGARMKALYRSLATKNRVKPFKRNYDPHDWDDQDPGNKALSAGNAALYGVVHSVLAHLGCHPALGFVHSGKQDAF